VSVSVCVCANISQARKDKQHFETSLASELSKREEELNTSWQEKVDKASANTGMASVLCVVLWHSSIFDNCITACFVEHCVIVALPSSLRAEQRWKIKYSGLEDELHTVQSRLDESQRG
jgi:hypothetical protein